MNQGNEHHDHDEPHQHDLGLSHDLPTVLTRRRALGLLSGAGLAAALAACSSDGTPSTSATGATTELRRDPERRDRLGRGSRHRDPRGDRRPVPGRRLERAQRADRERHRPQRHHAAASASASGVAEGVPLTIDADGARHRRRRRAARRRRGLPVALRPARAATRCTPTASPTRTTCAASRRPTADGTVDLHQHLPRRRTRAAGRTSTSRSTRASTTATDGQRQAAHLAARPARGRLRRGLRHRRLRAERRATCAQTSLDTDMVFSDGYSLQLATVTGDVESGMTATLNVPV